MSGSTAPGSSLAYSSGLEVALYAALILFSGVFTVIVFSQELRRLKFEDTIVAPGVRMTGPFSLQISSQFAVPGEVSTVSRAWDEDGSTSIITTDSHVTTIITEACCNTTTITTRPKGEPVA